MTVTGAWRFSDPYRDAPRDAARHLMLDRAALARLAVATAEVFRAADAGLDGQMAAARRIMDAHRGALDKLAE
ncbi:MAG: hypothetical protein H6907_04210 [Hyphomicrobiales bacterium]|nr:hypothetical protein [Hyphomicrobiales bacterium]